MRKICYKCGKNPSAEGHRLCLACLEESKQRNRENINACKRRWRKEHREEHNAYNREWNKRHREQCREYYRKWRERQREKVRALEMDELIRERESKGLCIRCGKNPRLADRRICRECHNAESRKYHREHREAILARKAAYRLAKKTAKVELCKNCGERPRLNVGRLCAECRKAYQRNANRKYYQEHREQEHARNLHNFHQANPEASYRVGAEEYNNLTTSLQYKDTVIVKVTQERDELRMQVDYRDSIIASLTGQLDELREELSEERHSETALKAKLEQAEERLKISERMMADCAKDEVGHLDEIAKLKDQLNEFQAFPTTIAEISMKEPVRVEVKRDWTPLWIGLGVLACAVATIVGCAVCR